MRSLLSVAATAATLLWLVSEPWYQHLPWPARAGVVLLAIALGVLAALAGTARRASDDGQEEDQ